MRPLTISVVKSPITSSSLMYHRYVTSGGFASAWHLYLTSEPSAMRPSLIVPPMADTLTFGAYFTWTNRKFPQRQNTRTSNEKKKMTCQLKMKLKRKKFSQIFGMWNHRRRTMFATSLPPVSVWPHDTFDQLYSVLDTWMSCCDDAFSASASELIWP